MMSSTRLKKRVNIMYMDIKSRDNEKFKYLKSLLKKKNRMSEKKYMVEGYRIIKQAMETGEKLHMAVFSESFEKNEFCESMLSELENQGTKVYRLDQKLFDEISDTQNSQGIIAVAHMKSLDVKEQVGNGTRFVLVLDRIQDPGNMGTIIRTADAAGVEAVVLLKGCVDVYNPKVLRSTMGSVFTMPILSANDSDYALDILKAEGFAVASSILETDSYYDEISYPQKIALVIGNEAHGIDQSIIERSDIKVKIPIYGTAESLNAGIAAGILMYKIAGFLYCK